MCVDEIRRLVLSHRQEYRRNTIILGILDG